MNNIKDLIEKISELEKIKYKILKYTINTSLSEDDSLDDIINVYTILKDRGLNKIGDLKAFFEKYDHQDCGCDCPCVGTEAPEKLDEILKNKG